LVVFGVVWGRLGGRFVSFLVVLGVVLASWGVILALLGGLGAVLAAVDGQECRGSDFPLGLGRFLDPSWHPKGTPKRPQDDQKSIKKSS